MVIILSFFTNSQLQTFFICQETKKKQNASELTDFLSRCKLVDPISLASSTETALLQISVNVEIGQTW